MANARIVAGTGFTGAAVAGLKTINVVSSHPTGTTGIGAAGQQLKGLSQVGPTGHKPNIEPMYLLAPTGTKGIPTIVIAGFTGAA
jgi:hypothetical protein